MTMCKSRWPCGDVEICLMHTNHKSLIEITNHKQITHVGVRSGAGVSGVGWPMSCGAEERGMSWGWAGGGRCAIRKRMYFKKGKTVTALVDKRQAGCVVANPTTGKSDNFLKIRLLENPTFGKSDNIWNIRQWALSANPTASGRGKESEGSL